MDFLLYMSLHIIRLPAVLPPFASIKVISCIGFYTDFTKNYISVSTNSTFFWKMNTGLAEALMDNEGCIAYGMFLHNSFTIVEFRYRDRGERKRSLVKYLPDLLGWDTIFSLVL